MPSTQGDLYTNGIAPGWPKNSEAVINRKVALQTLTRRGNSAQPTQERSQKVQG
ncbi:hypothetical protein [Microcoleus sp. D3_18a_C4]|uniref:hypothetical protein n=1 Tax=unclassified Microcoleus TaxID=2642155 RepID=UPI002FD27DE4